MRSIITCIILSGLFLIFFTGTTFAQHDLTIYNMQMVPQRIFQNPAFIPEQRLYIGIPVLSGVQSAVASPFSYNDAIERDSYDSVTLRVDNVLGKLSKTEQMQLYSNIEILSLGTAIAKNRFYLGFSLRERVCQQFTFPVNLGNLVWYGNADPRLFGKTVNIAPELDMIAFDEYGASLSGYALKDRITWGARVKFLAGRINSTTTRSDFRVYTDTGTYQLNMRSDIEYRTSGVDDIENYFDQPVSSLVLPENRGFGIDLGITYTINEQVSLNASVLDIGFINWKSNTLVLVSHDPGEEFAFKGVTLEGFVEMLDSLDKFGTKLRDSILDLVDIDSVYGRTYSSWLPVRYNLGGSFTLKEQHRFNLLLNAVSWNGRFNPALSVSYHYKIPRIAEFMASYSMYNRQYTNIGLGVSVNAGPVQLYLVSDNVPGLIFYRDTRNYSFQVGINIALKQKDKPPPETPEETETPPGEQQ